MPDKVKLPRKVAEAIDQMKYMGVTSLMACIARWEVDEPVTGELCTIHDYYLKNPYLIACALVNGYEIEPQTPEEIIRFRYDGYISSDDRKYRGMAIGLKEAIDILGIKIEGVNA
ncbi:DUF1642 domain-containing protein [Paenibacillus sp. HWE-109]|uniref:DUF1642 domain-containing protein n=1 Tax=Paenibacillus sp. HWE-109 TaxID=1306526 RepID=UPI001EDD0ABD|nr:DUF1642 domain-containing protein [Paenibacillus sp. HWE-109]UKS25055.1 DUF1642 domain-containing protein [Paenibacillus sp. HWE-109]